MALAALIVLLDFGAIAGFLAGLIVKGFGFGVVGSIVIVIVSAVLGGWPLPRLGVFAGGDSLGEIVTATIGAVMLLNPIGVLRGA